MKNRLSLLNIQNILANFLSKGHPRSIKAKKNIIASFGLKGISIVINFLLVPLTLNYIDVTRYGIWLTLNSIIGWFGFFDIGLGNGLRNKFAEALAKGQKELARVYVSTTYAVLLIIIGVVFLVFMGINPFLNWAKILNTPPEMSSELNKLVIIVFTFFCISFVLKLISIILIANQKPAINDSFNVIANLISLIIIYILTKTTSGSLLYLGITLSATPVIVMLIASIVFYNKEYKYYKPSFKYVDSKYFKSLANLGVKFFILQIACIVIFTTDNLIITQILGPAEVTPYNIAHKYFNIVIMVFTIILTPFWSAFTEAYTKNEINWIKNTINKLVRIWTYLLIGVIFMIIISNSFYHFWVGEKVKVPLLLSIGMGLYAIISTWNNIFAYFINGVGKIKLQMYYGIVAMIINIPVSIFLAKNLNMGSAGVIFGTCVSMLFGLIFGPFQYFKIINKSAKGIWNK
ncbi:MAG TPA: oligosaccharide flippase family protein [Candidatus Marinimicrobia bacterium]|nr:oligosaccharide flippase family protein [Candidatus Neomarinimicrobiota bacterium]HRU92721.1 oligosaccharide flippase family protein [Candidatus Neomarinimicrobiota bacterium]